MYFRLEATATFVEDIFIMAAPRAPDYNSSILIVGAGTWGCSTALHLARRGYKNVIVLDPYGLPSPISAGNDINKIIEEGKPPFPHCLPETSISSRQQVHQQVHQQADPPMIWQKVFDV